MSVNWHRVCFSVSTELAQEFGALPDLEMLLTSLMLKISFLCSIVVTTHAAYAVQSDHFVLGVITSSESNGAIALLKNKSSGKVAAHKIGSAVGTLTLDAVHLKYIILKSQTQKYKILVGSDAPQTYDEPNNDATSTPDGLDGRAISQGLEKSGDELRVQSKLKDRLINQDLAKVLMQAATEPYMKNGAILGFRLWEIEKDSIYEQAGFVNGDLITHINGMPLTDAGNAIATLKSLKEAKDVEITYVTGGYEKNLKVLIQ